MWNGARDRQVGFAVIVANNIKNYQTSETRKQNESNTRTVILGDRERRYLRKILWKESVSKIVFQRFGFFFTNEIENMSHHNDYDRKSLVVVSFVEWASIQKRSKKWVRNMYWKWNVKLGEMKPTKSIVCDVEWAQVSVMCDSL